MKLLSSVSTLARKAQFIGALCAGAVMLLGSGVQATTIISPNGLAGVEGDSGNAYPFLYGSTTMFTPSLRYQQVYSAGDFATLVSGGEYITQIAFRPDASHGGAFTFTLPDICIQLSTTLAGPDTLSTTFNSNLGANDTIVYGGVSGAPLTLSSSFTGPPAGPKNFDIIINLTTPFFYNPAAGNLLLDVRNFGGARITEWFDAQDDVGDSVSLVTTGGTGGVSGVYLPTGYASTGGLVTEFTTIVPEPGTMALAALGGASLLLYRRRK